MSDTDNDRYIREREREQGVIKSPNPPARNAPAGAPPPKPAIPPGTWESHPKHDPANPPAPKPNPKQKP